MKKVKKGKTGEASSRGDLLTLNPKEVALYAGSRDNDMECIREDGALEEVSAFISQGDEGDVMSVFNFEVEHRVCLLPPEFKIRGIQTHNRNFLLPGEYEWRPAWIMRHPGYRVLKEKILSGDVVTVLGPERTKELKNSLQARVDKESGRVKGGTKLSVASCRDFTLALGMTELKLYELVVPDMNDTPNLQWYVFQCASADNDGVNSDFIDDPEATDSDDLDGEIVGSRKTSSPSAPRYVCCINWSTKRSIGCVWSLAAFYTARSIPCHQTLCRELARVHTQQNWTSSMEERNLQARVRNEGERLRIGINVADMEVDELSPEPITNSGLQMESSQSEVTEPEDLPKDIFWYPGKSLTPERISALRKLGWRSWWLVEQAVSLACEKELTARDAPWDKIPISLLEELQGQQPSAVYQKIREALGALSWELGDERRVQNLKPHNLAGKSVKGLVDSCVEDLDDDNSILRYIIRVVPPRRDKDGVFVSERGKSILHIVMEGPFREGEDGRSCTAARAIPGERFIHVHVDSALRNSGHVHHLFRKGIFIAGRQWRAIYGKPVEGKLMMLAEEGVGLAGNEIKALEFRNRFIPYVRMTPPSGREDYMEVAMDEAIEFNRALKLSKYSSRFDMLFSSTLRGPLCGEGTAWDLPVHIHSLASAHTAADLGDGNCIMSENFMYHTCAKLVENGALGDMQMGFGVVQGRFGGLKGTWTVVKQDAWATALGMDDDPGKADRIPFAYAEGQLKFKPAPYEKEMRTLCVVKVGGIRGAPRKAPRLNAQFWTVLGARGLGPDTCKQIVDEAVDEIQECFQSPEAAFAALASSGAETVVERTLLGFFGADFRDEAGVCPVNIGRLTEQVRESRIRGITQPEFHVPLSKAGKALALPDFTQTLAPLQCVYGARETYGGPLEFIRGKVIVLQSPCHLWEDVCVLDAVEPTEEMKKAFLTLDGVIVLSAHPSQPRSTADLYSGADYDGDEPVIIWDKRIVNEVERLPDPWNLPPTADDVERVAEESLNIRSVAAGGASRPSSGPYISRGSIEGNRGTLLGGDVGKTVALIVENDGEIYFDPDHEEEKKDGMTFALANHFLRNSNMRLTLGLLTRMHERLSEEKPHSLRERDGMSRTLGLLLRAAVDADKYGHSLQAPNMSGGRTVVPWRAAVKWGSAKPDHLEALRKRVQQGKGTALDAVFLRLEDVHAELHGISVDFGKIVEENRKMDPDLVISGLPSDVSHAGKKLLREYASALARIMQRTSRDGTIQTQLHDAPKGFAARHHMALSAARAEAAAEAQHMIDERDAQIRALLAHLRDSFNATIAQIRQSRTDAAVGLGPHRKGTRMSDPRDRSESDSVVVAAQLTSAIYQAWFSSLDKATPSAQRECKLLAEAVPEHVQMLKVWKSILRGDSVTMTVTSNGTDRPGPRRTDAGPAGGSQPRPKRAHNVRPLILTAAGVALQAEARRAAKTPNKRARLMPTLAGHTAPTTDSFAVAARTGMRQDGGE